MKQNPRTLILLVGGRHLKYFKHFKILVHFGFCGLQTFINFSSTYIYRKSKETQLAAIKLNLTVPMFSSGASFKYEMQQLNNQYNVSLVLKKETLNFKNPFIQQPVRQFPRLHYYYYATLNINFSVLFLL